MSIPFRTSLDPWLDAPLTYDEVGGTADATMPAGYHHVSRQKVLGAGEEAFAAASTALWGWEVHRAAGLHVMATGPASMVGAVVAMTLGAGRWGLPIPCRVIDVHDADGVRSFTYGTLPGHPETGEERFLITLAADGTVVFEIRAFSRPATLLSRAGGPAARGAQAFYTGRYLDAARRFALGEAS